MNISEITQWLDLAVNGKKVVKTVVVKGDVPGHEFHGNQYTTHSGKLEKEHANMREALDTTRSEMAKPSPDYHGTVTDDDHMWDTSTGMKDAHRELGHYHRHEARLAREAGKSPEAHRKAADLHEKAYREALKYNRQTGYDGDYLEGNPSANEKIRLSERLLGKSEAALAASRAAEGVNKSAEILKGDLPGHPFRGNQYTHGEAADGAARLAERAKKLHEAGLNGGDAGGGLTLEPRDFVDTHVDLAAEHRDAAEKAPTVAGRVQHGWAANAHERAARAWADPRKAFTGEALLATKDARTEAIAARNVAERESQDAENRATAEANGRPTDSRGRAIVTADSPAAVVPADQLAVGVNGMSEDEYFKNVTPDPLVPQTSRAYTIPDGMVNPLTGELGTGSKEPNGYDPSRRMVVVQGERPGGSVFTRVIPDGSMRIGDRMNFEHDQTGRSQGSGRVIGVVDPVAGKAYGTFPNKKLSFHVPK